LPFNIFISSIRIREQSGSDLDFGGKKEQERSKLKLRKKDIMEDRKGSGGAEQRRCELHFHS